MPGLSKTVNRTFCEKPDGPVQSCPWVGLTHGFGWVGLGRVGLSQGFPVLVGWVELGPLQQKYKHTEDMLKSQEQIGLEIKNYVLCRDVGLKGSVCINITETRS